MKVSLNPVPWAPTGGAFFLALVGLGLAFLPVSCGDSAPGCVPGQSIACSLGTCEGHQVCRADGKAYGECVCGAGPNVEFPQTGPNSGLIGAACTSSGNCREGLGCLSSASRLIQGEGPSAGLCLARCVPDYDFCQELDARSKCIVLSDSGTTSQMDDVAYCLPGCELGTQPNEEDKCRGRIDLVCAESPAGSGVGYCRPACRADVDCDGRFCNLATGLCGDLPFSGDPIGAACDPEASAVSCAGGCIEHGAGYSECSGVCSFGTAGCGETGSSLPLDTFCFLDPTTAGSGAGDLGYCAKLCDCDDDCERDDAVCEPQPALEESTGRAGVCGSRTLASGGDRDNTPC